MHKGAAGIYVAAPIWKDFMNEALKIREKKDFEPMEPDKVDKPVLKGEIIPETVVKVHKISGKKATDKTPPELVEERKYRSVHCILYYVQKDDPRGDAPKNPKEDPQYSSWEGAVQGWAAKQGYSFDRPPDELDDSNSSTSQPTISITTPSSGAEINDSAVYVKTSVDASQGIKKVEFYVDGQKVSEDTGFPYETSINFSTYSTGFHNITAKITDLAGNTADSTISVNNKLIQKKPTSIALTSPGSIEAQKENFPLNLSAKVSGDLEITKVEFFVNDAVVSRQDGKGNNRSYNVSWTYPGPGKYTIYAATVDSTGRGVFSGKVTVNVE
jgi:hypothetical protein